MNIIVAQIGIRGDRCSRLLCCQKLGGSLAVDQVETTHESKDDEESEAGQAERDGQSSDVSGRLLRREDLANSDTCRVAEAQREADHGRSLVMPRDVVLHPHDGQSGGRVDTEGGN